MKRFVEILVCVILSVPTLFAALPTTFEPGRRDPATGNIVQTGPNVRWAVRIGSPTYATPVVANGKVLIGTLNDAQWDERRSGSRSVLLCFDEKTGDFLWQLPLPKDYKIPYFDSFCVGISSTPTIVGDRAFLTTGRGEILCIDLNGLENGNDGPYIDEARLYSFARDTGPPIPLAKTDADIVWRYDAFGELKAKPHDTNNCDIVYYGGESSDHEPGPDDHEPGPVVPVRGILVVNTGNSPDHTHVHVPNPEAPSLLLMDAATGVPLARDDFDIGSDISHGQWCSPTLGKVDGKAGKTNTIFYGGGNGVLYAVEAPSRESLQKRFEANGNSMIRLETAWKFHGDPRAQVGSLEEVPPFVMGMGSPSYTCLPPPLLDGEGRIFMLFGHDAWNGAKPFRSWLACIDAKTVKLRWGTENIEGGAVSPPIVDKGLLYFADRKGNFSCLDAATGREHWKLRLRGDIWARPLLADGKIYVGTDRRVFYALKAGREPRILAEITMPDRIFAPAAASGNTLYVVGDGFLYAVENR